MNRFALLDIGAPLNILRRIVEFGIAVLQALPESIVTVIGILAGSKAIQRFGENS
jgi:hypothetical protein